MAKDTAERKVAGSNPVFRSNSLPARRSDLEQKGVIGRHAIGGACVHFLRGAHRHARSRRVRGAADVGGGSFCSTSSTRNCIDLVLRQRAMPS